jgi:hypothetical protein
MRLIVSLCVEKTINFVKKRKMNAIELKRNFHNLIDSIENESLLMSFYELMKNKTSTQDGKLWDRLSVEEQEILLRTIDTIENSNDVISHSEMKKKHKQWL